MVIHAIKEPGDREGRPIGINLSYEVWQETGCAVGVTFMVTRFPFILRIGKTRPRSPPQRATMKVAPTDAFRSPGRVAPTFHSGFIAISPASRLLPEASRHFYRRQSAHCHVRYARVPGCKMILVEYMLHLYLWLDSV